jgi:hypothetical protein
VLAPGLVPIATVIVVVLSVVITLPRLSSTATPTAGETADPATVFVGWAMNASCAAAPAVMLKLALVAVPCAGLLAAASV